MAKKKEKWQKREQKLSGEEEKEEEEKVGSRIRQRLLVNQKYIIFFCLFHCWHSTMYVLMNH